MTATHFRGIDSISFLHLLSEFEFRASSIELNRSSIVSRFLLNVRQHRSTASPLNRGLEIAQVLNDINIEKCFGHFCRLFFGSLSV